MSSCDWVKGAVVGALIGAVVGILYAPKSGKETREELLKSAQELLDQAEKQYDLARRKMDDLVEAGKDLYSTEKKVLKKTLEKLA